METRKFKNREKGIDVKVDVGKREVWLSQKDLSKLFGKSIKTINIHINNVLNDSVILPNKNTETCFSVTGSDGKTYNVKHYNQDIILQVGYKCNIGVANAFKEWLDTLFKEDDTPNASNNWLSGANNYEIVKFESGEVSLDVNVSPTEDTVWLTQNDMAILFDVTISNISQHISNIYESKELEMIPTIKNFLTVQNEGDRKISRNVNYYNLDMVISVGYRVNSKRGIEFRSWATNVLKQYLIKGYAINTKRCMEHSDILISISNDITELRNENKLINNRLDDHDRLLEKINASEVLTDGKLVYEGNIYEAYYFIKHLFSMAKNRLIIIDGYVNDSVLEMLNDVNVDIIIYTYPSAPLKNIDIQVFSINHSLSVIKQNSIHSRYIIVDDIIYSISESIKDAGKKRFVSQIIDIITANDLLAGMH